MEDVGEEQDEEPMVSAEDTLLPIKEQRERLIAAATRKRMGVKT